MNPRQPARAATWKTTSTPLAADSTVEESVRSPRSNFNAEACELGVLAALECADGIAALEEGADDGLAEKTAAAVTRAFMGSLRRPEASFSRPILALWRISTGKRGWKRSL